MMAGFPISEPFNTFPDVDGSPLEGGFIYIGTAGSNPETNLISVYWDSALTIPAAQPLRTSGGFITRNGSPSNVYTATDFSMTVRNKNNALVFSKPYSKDLELSNAAVISAVSGSGGSANVGFTQAETGAVASTVQTKLRQELNVDDFGAVGDNTTDDYTAFKNALDAAYGAGGGVVKCKRGRTYKLVAGADTLYTANYCALIRDNVTLDLNGATLNCHVSSGAQVAVWMFGDMTSVKNGKINALSSGTPASQFFFHAPISIGLFNNSGATPGAPGDGQYMYGWSIENVELYTNRTYCPVIQGVGGINNGVIKNVFVPDNAACSGVHLDWGNVGTISSADIPASKTDYLANNAFTTHPNNIDIQNIKLGNLTVTPSGDLGANIVRLSACHNIRIKGALAASVSYCGFLNTGGDLGFEFADSGDRTQAYKGIVCEGMVLRNPTSNQNGVRIDTLADNIYREQYISGYTPLIDPLQKGSVVVRNSSFKGDNTANHYGARIIQADGVSLIQNTFTGFDIGVLVDEHTQNIKVEKNIIHSNRSDGIRLGSLSIREDTAYIDVSENEIYGNGTASTGYGVNVLRALTSSINRNVLGVAGESTQVSGIRLGDEAFIKDIQIKDNTCLGSSGPAYSVGATAAPYYHRQVYEFSGNRLINNDIGTVPFVNSPDIVPVLATTHLNRVIKHYNNSDLSDPTTGSWAAGELFFRVNPTTLNPALKSVVTSGTFGTLSGLTNGATNTSSGVITCSLAGITATTTAGSYTVNVSSATNIRAGMLITITSAGINNARIISISGTQLNLNKFALSSQAGVALLTAGLVEGEVISLDTTPAVSGATVLKIDDDSVTLDQLVSSTETGRTVTYTVPVFKDHANIK